MAERRRVARRTGYQPKVRLFRGTPDTFPPRQASCGDLQVPPPSSTAEGGLAKSRKRVLGRNAPPTSWAGGISPLNHRTSPALKIRPAGCRDERRPIFSRQTASSHDCTCIGTVCCPAQQPTGATGLQRHGYRDRAAVTRAMGADLLIQPGCCYFHLVSGLEAGRDRDRDRDLEAGLPSVARHGDDVDVSQGGEAWIRPQEAVWSRCDEDGAMRPVFDDAVSGAACAMSHMVHTHTERGTVWTRMPCMWQRPASGWRRVLWCCSLSPGLSGGDGVKGGEKRRGGEERRWRGWGKFWV
ncbi:uncharacterized protein PSFLO_00090 [Pseudozyma flocculosa]|uniref:Uncharacterized protein n=1 Tax=Pseudozyma flocculosa TaxID=84751 RepID=A0A5C3EU65_9BASI|nr:uncharacterized protein PSFLO_00090 [Pseudozyma flocculosa]